VLGRVWQEVTVGVVKAILNFLWDLLYFLTGEGSWKLRPHERVVLDAAISSFSDDIQMQLLTQIKQLMFIQRSHSQIIRPRFYSIFYVKDQAKIENEELAHMILNVQISVDGEKQNSHVEFFQGRIDSIQFKQPGKFYMGKAVSVIGIKIGKLNFSHAAAIDRCEHGRKQNGPGSN